MAEPVSCSGLVKTAINQEPRFFCREPKPGKIKPQPDHDLILMSVSGRWLLRKLCVKSLAPEQRLSAFAGRFSQD